MTRADGDRASETMRGDIERLGPWFHNIHLPFNLQTAPDHVYGDFPAFKWRAIADHIPVERDIHDKRAEMLEAGPDGSYFTGQVLHPNGGDIVGA